MHKKSCKCKCPSSLRRDRTPQEYKEALKKMYAEQKKKGTIYEEDEEARETGWLGY